MKTNIGFVLILILFWSTVSCKRNNNLAIPSIISLSDDSSMIFLENDRIKLGINLELGGAITFLSDEANGGDNMINSFDWGRQIQMSYYSGPWPYLGPNGERPSPSWEGLGWNPIQSGDSGDNRSQMISYENRGDNSVFIRSIPMIWPHTTGVTAECVFECLYKLEENVITIEATIVNNREDETQYPAAGQEMPAVYTNGAWYKLVSYMGDKPFMGEPTTTIVAKNNQRGWPWLHFYTPENWVALLDDNGYGIGVFQPEVMTFNGGFHPNDSLKGYGGEKDVQTGHIAPVARQIIDHNIRWTYTTSLILGTENDIRSYATENRPTSSHLEWDFNDSRKNWYYQGEIKDNGFPINKGLNIQFNKNSAMVGPITFWEASEKSFLEIEGEFLSEKKELELIIEIQPVSKSDFTDWLNWSEGEFSTIDERKLKKSEFPTKPAIIGKKVIIADGIPKKYRINLSELPNYQGGMKSVKLSFSDSGKAMVTKISLVK